MNDTIKLPISSKYRKDIDGLRAVAVLAVIGFHAFPGWVKGGFVGVDIFFVISGFLISTILIDGMERNTFSFTEFYLKRIKRIFPALSIILVFCLAFGWFSLFPHEYQQLGRHITGGAGFISNFLLWQDAGYFDSAAETKPLLHLWSLGIEEQFYIIWPLLLWIAWKKQLNIFTVIVLIALISFVFNMKGIRSQAIATFYSPQTRFWELLCGSLLAWLMLYKQDALFTLRKKIDNLLNWIIYRDASKTNRAIFGNTISLIGLLIIAYSIALFSKTTIFPGAWALLPVLGALFIILAGTDSWINRTILSNRIMVWFGLISFPLYLWHWPLLSFARILEEDTPNRAIRLATVAISVILAWLTYKLIEKPIRFGGGSDRIKTFLLIVCMVIIALSGLYVQKHKGLSFRIKEENINMANLESGENSLDCSNLIPSFKKFNFDGGCTLSKNTAPEIMLIGDSHAGHYLNAFKKHFSLKSVLAIVQTSCLPFSNNNFLQGDCKEKYNSIITFLENNSSIKKVYLSGYWAYLMTGGFSNTGANWRTPKNLDAEGAISFKENGANFLAKILKTNKEVIFFKDIPDLDFNINYCFKERPIHLPYSKRILKEKCYLNFANYKKRVADYDKVIDELVKKFPQIKVYNPRPLFCKNEKCMARDELYPYYYNGDHLNYYGADIVIKDMLKKLG